MGGKNQTSTTNSSQTYTPTGASQLNQIWDKVQQAASTPYQAYTGQMVAGLDPTQTAGIAGINAAQGTAQPYYDQATAYAKQGASSITPEQIQQYISPYTQNVVDATQKQFNNANAQQQQQVLGNAAKLGALGGDRVGIAQAELANQQNLSQSPVIAGLYNNAYTQGLGAAQQDRAAAAQGAYSLGSLGSAVQNTALQGATTQLAAGSVPQQNQQQQLSAQYQQYLQQMAYPYQQAQFLASYGLPTATAMGGTQSGQSTNTQPGPNQWGQIAGLGLTGASLFLKDGGRVKGYASGGSPMSAENFILVPSFIPQGEAPQSRTPQMSPMQTAQAQKPSEMALPSSDSLKSGIGGLQNLYDSMTWTGGTPLEGSLPIGQGGIGHAARGGRIGYASGGIVDAVKSIHHALKDGGAVTPSLIPQGYDIGGGVDAPLSFADRALPVQSAISSGAFDPQGDNYSPFTAPHVANAPVQANVPVPMARPQMADAQPEMAPSPMASTRVAIPQDAPVATPTVAATEPGTMELSAESKKPSGGLFGTGLLANLSPEAKSGLLAAGLGMMASKSPFALTQIGEGGLQGVQTYNAQKKETADRALQQQRVDQEAKRLAESSAQFAKTFGLHQEQLSETKQQHALEGLKPIKIGTDVTGRDIYAIRDPKNGTFKILDQNGQVIDANAASANQPSTSSGSAAPVEIRAQAAPGSPRARNEDFFNTLEAKNPGYAAQVKAAADYMIDPSKVFSMRNNIREQFLRNVYQYDPTYDATTFPARNRAVSEFSTGKLGNQIRSFDVSIAHLATLDDLVKNLDNTRSPLFNKVANAFKQQFGQEAPVNFDAAKSIVADEIAKGIIGGQTALADREDLQTKLSKANSPEQLAGVIRTFKQLLGGQLHGLKKQYEDTTKLHNFDERLTPLTREEISRAENYHKPKGAGGAPPPPSVIPQRVRQNGHTYERQPDGSMKAID